MNLMPPLLAIPIILAVLQIFSLLPKKSFGEGTYELLGDGQLCFYAIAVLSASGHEIFESTKTLKGYVFLHIVLLLLCFGFFVLAVIIDRLSKTPHVKSGNITLTLGKRGVTITSVIFSAMAMLLAGLTYFTLKFS